MDPDAVLDWILRLRATLDAAIADGCPVDPDAVYTLVGLLEELDGWLAAGHPSPRRWRPALVPRSPLVLPNGGAPQNDCAPRRRRARVRADAVAPCDPQLVLPFRTTAR